MAHPEVRVPVTCVQDLHDVGASVGLIGLDADGRVEACNPEAARLLGCARARLMRLAPGGCVPGLLDEDGRALAPGWPCAGQVVSVARPDGRLRWIRVDAAEGPEGPAGERRRILALRDVTAAHCRAAEIELLRALLACRDQPDQVQPFPQAA